MDILNNKNIKLDYSNQVVNLLNLMAINPKNILIVGSMNIKSMQYANDYDACELLKNTKFEKIQTTFKKNIRKLMNMKDTYIGDIKLGNYKNEAVRWKIDDILNGYVILPNQQKYTFVQGLESCKNDKTHPMFKLDLVALINSVYRELSCVYSFDTNTNVDDIKNEMNNVLKDEIKKYYEEANYYKCAKRIFSRAIINNNIQLIKKLHPLFIGDLGIISSVYQNIETLEYLINNQHNLSIDKLTYEIDNFKSRLSNVYQTAEFLKNQKKYVNLINKSEKNKKNMKIYLSQLYNDLFQLVQNETISYFKKKKLTFTQFFI